MNVGVELIAESRFDKQLGPHVRRWAYCHLLFDKCSYALLTQGASLLERIVAWFLMPLLRRIVYSALYCNRPGAKERSLQVVEAIFKEVFVWFPFSPVFRLFHKNSFLFVQPPICMHSYPACKFLRNLLVCALTWTLWVPELGICCMHCLWGQMICFFLIIAF